MSFVEPGWAPDRHAVHRLIQLCDVLSIALNRFQHLSFHLPDEQSEEYLPERQRLWDDYFAVRRAVFPTEDSASQHTAFRLACDAVAELTRAGSTDRAAVHRAQEWLGAVGWVLVPCAAPKGHPLSERWNKFESEQRLCGQHTDVRNGLIAALALIGQPVPKHVYQRARLASVS
jgi:hypothetical protein